MGVETVILVIVVLSYLSSGGIIKKHKNKTLPQNKKVVIVKNETNNKTNKFNLPKIPLGDKENISEQIKNFILKMNKNIDENNAKFIAETIVNESQTANLNPKLVAALICKESSFNSKAVSSSGALGLGQLLPQTAREVGVSDPFEAAQNIKGTVEYLRRLFVKWQNYADVTERVLASYRVGAKLVEMQGGVPQTSEVQSFITGIKKYMEMIK